MRKQIILANTTTKERLYLTSKNPKNIPQKIKLKKYSPKLKCRIWFTEVN
ncbi:MULTISPECIES: 50S ribosomal protein L33 [Levilactobacillus]|nr:MULTISPECIES: 50S ribosomal protein L33 [Levilactobacillus]AJA81554.1 50S ribosomal protein L33 [Levilactobacillus brevis BSO 464]